MELKRERYSDDKWVDGVVPDPETVHDANLYEIPEEEEKEKESKVLTCPTCNKLYLANHDCSNFVLTFVNAKGDEEKKMKKIKTIVNPPHYCYCRIAMLYRKDKQYGDYYICAKIGRDDSCELIIPVEK